MRGEFSNGAVRSVLTNLLGFFGGDAIGVSQGWIVIPVIVVFALAAVFEIDRQKPGKPVHFLLLMLGAPVPLALAGFATPRSFLYLTPVAAADNEVFRPPAPRAAHPTRARGGREHIGGFGIGHCQPDVGDASVQAQSVVPYRAIFDFIDANASGSALVISTDRVVPWIMRFAGENRCAGYFSRRAALSRLWPPLRFDFRNFRTSRQIHRPGADSAIQRIGRGGDGRTKQARQRADRP